MAHKTNYKDALFEQRKYRMQNNPDGTVTPIDETDYTQEGDRVGASEFNEIGNALNERGYIPRRLRRKKLFE